jgi:hypothetical protein
MRVTKRLVNVRRHTKAYIVGGKRMPRGMVVKLARRHKIEGVSAYKRTPRWCVASKPSTQIKLYDLPIKVESK